MADYNKQTVAQLRQLLKDRGIPSTGLTRKAQIVEKLEEADGEGEAKAQDAQVESEDAPGPALAEAGGMSMLNGTSKCKADTTIEPPAQPDQTDIPPIPTATLDGNRETISHIDSDVPP